jgi:hypothetical protein
MDFAALGRQAVAVRTYDAKRRDERRRRVRVRQKVADLAHDLHTQRALLLRARARAQGSKGEGTGGAGGDG